MLYLRLNVAPWWSNSQYLFNICKSSAHFLISNDRNIYWRDKHYVFPSDDIIPPFSVLGRGCRKTREILKTVALKSMGACPYDSSSMQMIYDKTKDRCKDCKVVQASIPIDLRRYR